MSRHSPICVKLDLGNLPVRSNVKYKIPIKPSWSKSLSEDKQNYSNTLKSRLESLKIPEVLVCSNPHCVEPCHSEQRESFMLDILLAIVETSFTTLPLGGGRKVGGKGKGGCQAIPGWNEEVQPYRKESMY